MSDKLEWMNRHLVLLRHDQVADTVREEGFELNDNTAPLAQTHPLSEDFLAALAQQDQYKEACSYLTFNLHKRNAVWWGYQCVVSLLEELKRQPAQIRELDDIAKPKPLQVPDWAQVKVPDLSAEEAETQQMIAEVNSRYQQAQKMRSERMPPELKKKYDRVIELFSAQFKQRFGYSPQELLDLLVEKASQDDGDPVDRANSPIFKARDELKAKIEKVRQDTIALVKTALPAKNSAKASLSRKNALDIVFRYVAAPDERNAAAALEAGNACPDQPEGMLALCAFWSFGNMTPLGKSVIKTPAVLLPTGLNSLMLMLGLAKGGVRSFNERMQHYYELGIDVARGSNVWPDFLGTGDMPHAAVKNSAEQVASVSPVHDAAAPVHRFRVRPPAEEQEDDRH